MTPTTVSEITSSSFRITWNHDELPNVASRTLYLYEGNSTNPIYSIANITLNGSQLFTDLKPNVVYKTVIQTTFSNANVASLDTQFVTTLQLEQENPSNPNVTATLQSPETKNNTGYWILGIFTTLFVIITAAIKRRNEAAD